MLRVQNALFILNRRRRWRERSKPYFHYGRFYSDFEVSISRFLDHQFRASEKHGFRYLSVASVLDLDLGRFSINWGYLRNRRREPKSIQRWRTRQLDVIYSILLRGKESKGKKVSLSHIAFSTLRHCSLLLRPTSILRIFPLELNI